MRRTVIVPALRLSLGLCLVAAAAAEDAPSPGARPLPGPTPSSQPPVGGGNRLAPRETSPGRPWSVAGRQVTMQGLFQLDLIQSDNLLDATRSQSDHRGFGTMRGELAASVQTDDKAVVVIGVGYRGEMGDYGPTNTTPGPATSVPNGSNASPQSQAAITQAHLWLKELFGFESAALRAGRMPVSWYLRKEAGALLYDSRANDPVVRSWDGGQLGVEFDDYVITPSVYKLPDTSLVYGAQIDWKPTQATTVDDTTWLSLGVYENRRPVMSDRSVADSLRTFHIGFDAVRGGWETWGEAALQRGRKTSDVQFGGWGFRGGFEQQVDGETHFAWGLLGGWTSGDRDPTDHRDDTFHDRWESVGDTLIMESEQYGELQRNMEGNLQSLKLKLGFGFNRRNTTRLELIAARFRLHRGLKGSARDLGHEADLRLAWDATDYATITLFGGVFIPGAGARDLLLQGPTPPRDAGRDNIYLGGAQLRVEF